MIDERAQPTAPARTFAFGLLLLLSGFCGISYEVLYARILSNFIGDQFAVNASVLLTFLVGIGFGTLYAHRLWRFLWLIEALVGLCGVGFALGAGRFGAWLDAGTIGRGGLGESVLVCVLLLSVPAFLIGCSLPLFGGYLDRLGSARAFARAYSVYNVGAALTVLAIEFVLLRWLGIRATVLTMAAINGVISLGLALGFPELRRPRLEARVSQRFAGRDLTALALASVASAIFQLLMIKLAECVFGPFRETFAMVLALVLVGIAAGAALAERWKVGFAPVLLAGLGGLVFLIGSFEPIAHLYAQFHPWAIAHYATAVLLKLAALTLMMGLPAAAFGATIPTLLASRGDVARDSGRLLFVSSTANGAGFLLMAFVLHQRLDYGALLLVVAALTSLAVLVQRRFRGRSAVAAVAGLALAAALHHARWDEKLLYLGHVNFFSAEDLDQARGEVASFDSFRGYQDVFSLIRRGAQTQFFINGFVSIELGSPPEPIVGAFPATLAPRTDRAMVLGLGSGMTAMTVGLLFDRTDAVEINPAVVANLWRMKQWNLDIASNPKVRIVQDDGIHFLRASRETYSLVVNTVTTPLYFSSSKLYTRDFFETVKQRLAPDGIYVTWVDSRVGDRGLDIILQSLRSSFRECWLGALRSEYFLLACSNAPIAVRRPDLVAANSTLAGHLFRESGLRAEWIPYSLIRTRALDLIGDAEAPVNTLDRPALEFEIALAGDAKIDRFKERLVAKLSYTDVAASLAPVMAYDPVQQALYLYMLLGECDILDRWRSLAGLTHPGFQREYRQARIAHLADWAARAGTATAHYEYAWHLAALGQDEAAIVEYRAALALAPDRQDCRVDLGVSYEHLGDLDAADREYGSVLTAYPSDPGASLGRGRILVKRGRFEEALPFLKVASPFDETGDADLYLGLARAGVAAAARGE